MHCLIDAIDVNIDAPVDALDDVDCGLTRLSKMHIGLISDTSSICYVSYVARQFVRPTHGTVCVQHGLQF